MVKLPREISLTSVYLNENLFNQDTQRLPTWLRQLRGSSGKDVQRLLTGLRQLRGGSGKYAQRLLAGMRQLRVRSGKEGRRSTRDCGSLTVALLPHAWFGNEILLCEFVLVYF